MAEKARVHELAREFGVPSKDVLGALKEMGEFVKSASSTVEAPVVRRLTEVKGDEWRAAAAAKAARAAAAAAKKAAKTAESTAGSNGDVVGVKPGPRTTARAESSNGSTPTEVAPPVVEAPAVATETAREEAPAPEATPSAAPDRSRPAEPSPHPPPARRRRRAWRPPAPTSDEGTATTPSAVPRPPGPKPSGPRPGNNPFSSTQGMQRSRRPDAGAPAAAPAHKRRARAPRRPAAAAQARESPAPQGPTPR